MINRLSFVLFLLLTTLAPNVGVCQEYSCALTENEYSRLKDVEREFRQTDKQRTKLLRKIQPSLANKYAQFKGRKEKNDYIAYLVNHQFDTVDINHPGNKDILEFLKALNFAVVGAKDVDRCLPVKEKLRAQYGDTLRFYYSPLPRSGCELLVYEVTARRDIDELGCFLKTVADQHHTGTLFVRFYEKEVFESIRTLPGGSTTIAARGDEKMIEKLFILSEHDRPKANLH